MEINISSRGDVTVVEINGRIVDGPPAEQLHKELRKLVSEKMADTVFDLSGVQWFDSVGIGLLICHYVSVSRLGGRIVLLKADDKIKKLMRMVRLDDRFHWSEELEEALSVFRP